jgi:hypothetical protein
MKKYLLYSIFCFVLSFVLLFAIADGFGATYYVDSSSGSDSNSGLSESLSWRSLDKVNGFRYIFGDVILFKRGSAWRGCLSPPLPSINFSAYGTGELPIIDSTGFDSSVWIDNKNSVTISNLYLKNGNFGIRIKDSCCVIVDGVKISGCLFNGTDSIGVCTNVIFQNMDISNCGGCGINWHGDQGSVNYFTAKNNTVRDCGWNAANDNWLKTSAGIKVWGSSHATIENNEVYGQQDKFGDMSGTGIWVDTWSNGTVRYNYVHDNVGDGILVELSPNSLVQHNISRSNKTGVQLFRGTTNTQIKNNILENNTTNILYNQEGIGNTSDSNYFIGPVFGTNPIRVGRQ